jgi:hypothetical protein
LPQEGGERKPTGGDPPSPASRSRNATQDPKHLPGVHGAKPRAPPVSCKDKEPPGGGGGERVAVETSELAGEGEGGGFLLCVFAGHALASTAALHSAQHNAQHAHASAQHAAAQHAAAQHAAAAPAPAPAAARGAHGAGGVLCSVLVLAGPAFETTWDLRACGFYCVLRCFCFYSIEHRTENIIAEQNMTQT